MEISIEPFEGLKVSIVSAKLNEKSAFPDKAPENIPYTIIDADYIMDSLQIVSAAAAVLAFPSLVTKNVHSELLYQLSPSTNVEKTLSHMRPNPHSAAAIFASLELTLSELKDKIQHDYGDKFILDDSVVLRPKIEVIRKLFKIPADSSHILPFVVTAISTKSV